MLCLQVFNFVLGLIHILIDKNHESTRKMNFARMLDQTSMALLVSPSSELPPLLHRPEFPWLNMYLDCEQPTRIHLQQNVQHTLQPVVFSTNMQFEVTENIFPLQ